MEGEQQMEEKPQMQEGSQSYDIEDLKPIEAGEMQDLSEHEGKKVKIEKTEVIELDSNYAVEKVEIDGKIFNAGEQLPPGKTVKSKALKVTTEKVGEVKTSEGEVKELRASELISLKKKADGSWGWSTHKKARIQKLFMRLKAKYGDLAHPKDLIGCEVTIIIRPGEDISWLGFMI